MVEIQQEHHFFTFKSKTESMISDFIYHLSFIYDISFLVDFHLPCISSFYSLKSYLSYFVIINTFLPTPFKWWPVILLQLTDNVSLTDRHCGGRQKRNKRIVPIKTEFVN